MPILIYTLGILALTAILLFFSYLDRVYRELGRVSTGRTHAHLELFEAEVEPRFHMDRQRAALAFSLLARLWLVMVAAITARAVIFFALGTWEAALEMIFFLGAEVVVAMQFLPSLLLARAPGNWIAPIRSALFACLYFSPGPCWPSSSSSFPCFTFPKKSKARRLPSSKPSKTLWMPPPKRESSNRTKRA